MKRRVGDVIWTFNPNKHEGFQNLRNTYGNVRGEGKGHIKSQTSLVPIADASERLREMYRSRVPFFDLRERASIAYQGLQRAVPMNYHDIISGAIRPILPLDTKAALVVIASSYRGHNAVQALRDFGYPNSIWVSFEDVSNFDQVALRVENHTIANESKEYH